MINSLPKITTKSGKRRGRGVGSGKGFHTTGRGQKGQGARRHIGILFEGVKTKKSLLHRLPMLRGKDKFKTLGKPHSLNIERLEFHPEGKVTVESLIENGIVRASRIKNGIKLIGNTKVTKKFEVALLSSKSAKKAIEEAGGTFL